MSGDTIIGSDAYISNSAISANLRIGDGLSIVDSSVSGGIFRVISESKVGARCDGFEDELVNDDCNP